MSSRAQTRRHSKRNRERGVTILLIVIALVAMLGMAALAIDLVTLYAARTEAQRAADAAALAGAKMFVLSGFTSSLLGSPSSTTLQGQVCVNNLGPGGAAIANRVAQEVAAQNQIVGQPAVIQSIACNFTLPENPQITVAAQRTGLPTFFARVWGRRLASVSAAATAEAFNASGSSVSIHVASVKPWLIPNCDPATAPPCPGSPYFVDPAQNYALNNPGAYIGKALPLLTQRNAGNPPASSQYYVINLPQATVCPSSAAVSCIRAGNGGYFDNIACANTNSLSCGQTVLVNEHTGGSPLPTDTAQGAQCLIHTTSTGAGGTEQDAFNPGSPVTIDGGSLNPNPALRGISNISRSDSVVTVPIYDGHNPCTGGGECKPPDANATIIGFLQLGIQYVTSTGGIQAVVLNAVGCNPVSSGTPVSGGGISPLPVRLIHN